MKSASGAQPRYDELLLSNLTGSSCRSGIGPSAEWTGAELLARAGGAAAHLEATGVARGRPVVALLESSPRSMAYLVAGVLGDRPLAPLNPRAPLTELGPVAAALDASAVLTEPHVVGLAREVAAAAGGLPVVVAEDPAAAERDWRGLAGEVAMVLHTSGTTGRARPVPQPMVPLAHRIAAYSATVDFGRGDLFTGAAPFHHVAGAGMVLVALGAGAGVASVPWFSVDAWRWVRQIRPTHVMIVPTMIEMLLRTGELDAGMRTLMYGASPIHPDTLVAMLKAVPDTALVQIFGQTEASPVTALTYEDHLVAAGGRPELLRSVGRPVPGVELRIEDPDEHGIGEVAMRGGTRCGRRPTAGTGSAISAA
ncbi:AMP-binding protein [Actinomadura sp. SCN-SB]|uniref:AMP-binding protein n=1 Tax=Actinomadura sp. SCN-SB TaxID=3373092 RepID=UPI003753544A